MKNKNRNIIQLLICFLIMTTYVGFAQEIAVSNSSLLQKASRVTDSLALVHLYETTKGEEWTQIWDLQTPLDTWYGVHLNDYGRVMCLDLDGDPDCSARKSGGNKLQGSLPDLHLPELEHLFLAGNKLTGELPDFQHLGNLLTLQLCCNAFTGEIPDFTHLTRLNSLELDYNKLTGTIPNFKNMLRLENLYLSDNNLSGAIPEFSQLPELKRLYLHKNQLGQCPAKFQPNQISRLLLAGNKLAGELPDMTNLTEIQYVSMAGNALTGNIPNLDHMRNLMDVDFSQNQFTGNVPLFKDQPLLRSVRLSQNKLEEGVSWKNLPALATVELSDNYLSFSELEELSTYLRTQSTYENQLINGEDAHLILEEGESLLLNLDFDKNLANAVYTWYVNGQIAAEQTGKSKFYKEEISKNDYGIWFCEIQHSDFPGLTLQSPDFIVAATQEDSDEIDNMNYAAEIRREESMQTSQALDIPESFWVNRDAYYVLPENPSDAAVSLLVCDANGRIIYQSNDYQNDWDGSDDGSSAILPVGVYFYRVSYGKQSQAGSLLIVRE